ELDRQLVAEPRNPALYARRAAAHSALSNYSAAEMDWSRAIELAPDQPSHRLERGLIRAYYQARPLWHNKKAQEAARSWEEGVKDLLETVEADAISPFHTLLINEVVWAVACQADAGPELHRMSAQLSDRVRSRWTGYAELNTLGVVYYRVGRDRES